MSLQKKYWSAPVYLVDAGTPSTPRSRANPDRFGRPSALPASADPKVRRTCLGRLERGESGVTVEALAAILAALGVSLREFFKPFREVVRPRTPRS